MEGLAVAVAVDEDLQTVVGVDVAVPLRLRRRQVRRGRLVALHGDEEGVGAVADPGLGAALGGPHREPPDALVEVGQGSHRPPRRVVEDAIDARALLQCGHARHHAELPQVLPAARRVAVGVEQLAELLVDVDASRRQLQGRKQQLLGAGRVGGEKELLRLPGQVLGQHLQPLPGGLAQLLRRPGGDQVLQHGGEALLLGRVQQVGVDPRAPVVVPVGGHELEGGQDLALHGRVGLGLEARQQGGHGLGPSQVAEGAGHAGADPRLRVLQPGHETGEDAAVGLAQVEPVEGLGQVDASSRRQGSVLEGGDQRIDGRALGHVQGQPRLLEIAVALDDGVDVAPHGVAAGRQPAEDAGEDEGAGPHLMS